MKDASQLEGSDRAQSKETRGYQGRMGPEDPRKLVEGDAAAGRVKMVPSSPGGRPRGLDPKASFCGAPVSGFPGSQLKFHREGKKEKEEAASVHPGFLTTPPRSLRSPLPREGVGK